MYLHKRVTLLVLIFSLYVGSFVSAGQMANPETYLDSVKMELQKKWPDNKTINLVFHGHSVPTGYTTKGVVDRLNSYPFQTLKTINDRYPYSVVNAITTSIGGEQSEQGSARFEDEVLSYRPDVLFIDYALNDRSIGLERAKVAWQHMIEQALEHHTKVILLTPTPDLREDTADSSTALAQHSEQIRELAKVYEVGLVDSYALFKKLAETCDLNAFMAQNNHINQKGHRLVADKIVAEYFKMCEQPSKKN